MNLAVAQFPRRPRRGRVQKAARILVAVGAEPQDLNSVLVVYCPSNWPTNDGYTHQLLRVLSAQRKAMPDYWLVVSMVLGYKGVCLCQFNVYQAQSLTAFLGLEQGV